MTDVRIPFSSPMIRALLAGRKTQTRRGLGHLRTKGKISELGPSTTAGYDWHFRDKAGRWHDVSHARLLELLPWKAGDRLWVREAWRAHSTFDGEKGAPPPSKVFYIADRKYEPHSRYRHARFMPRWASRLTLLVSEVRVQRLQEISEADAVAEGVEPWDGKDGSAELSARDAYSILWGRLHGYDSWNENPYVAAVTFSAVKANIDETSK